MKHAYGLPVVLMMSLWITAIRAQSEGDSSDATKWLLKTLIGDVKTSKHSVNQSRDGCHDHN